MRGSPRRGKTEASVEDYLAWMEGQNNPQAQ